MFLVNSYVRTGESKLDGNMRFSGDAKSVQVFWSELIGSNTKQSGIKTLVTVGDENHNRHNNNHNFWKGSL